MTLGADKALESQIPAQPSDDSGHEGQDPFLSCLALSTQKPIRNHWGSVIESMKAGRRRQAEHAGTVAQGDEGLKGLAEPCGYTSLCSPACNLN